MTALTVKQLCLKKSNRLLYQNMNCTFNAGEFWGVLGLNGAGKTTFLHTLAGLVPDQQPHILLNEQPLHHLSSQSRAKQIGLLFQEFIAHFPQTVWDYCYDARFPHTPYFSRHNKQNDEIVTAALAEMNLLSCKTRRIHQLSGGEKRRLAIAALLAQTPSIYLLDEPTHHLDIPFQQKLLNHLQSLTQSNHNLIIISTHDINLVQRYCTHVLLLLPQGDYQSGIKKNMLTPDYLHRVYLQPMVKIDYNQYVFWQAVDANHPISN